MPKLIIPNALDLNQTENYGCSHEEAQARQFYNMRFLWMLNAGDIIILPQTPNKEFISYLSELKKIDPCSFKIIEWETDFNVPTHIALKHPNLINRLKQDMTDSTSWSIQTCFFNQAIIDLADNLNIPIKQTWRRFAEQNFGRQLNSKALFRTLSEKHNIPIPIGKICSTATELSEAIKIILPITGQAILKQEYNAGGRGNIGIGMDPKMDFQGVIEIIQFSDQNAHDLSNALWDKLINEINHQLIVEVYYPNTGTFTVNLFVSSKQHEFHLLNYSEIRMESTWVGVEMPAHALTKTQIEKLTKTAAQYATLLQAQDYEGYLACDVIRTLKKQILFTEINVRPAAETHAHVVATHLFGVKYYEQLTLLTRNGIKVKSFTDLQKNLATENLLYNHQHQSGVIILTIEDQQAKQAEFLVIGKNKSEAIEIEKKMLTLF